MKGALDTNIFIDGFRSEEAQAAVFAFLNRALPFTFLSADALIAVSCRERGITLITRDTDFRRLSPFVKGFRYTPPWPSGGVFHGSK